MSLVEKDNPFQNHIRKVAKEAARSRMMRRRTISEAQAREELESLFCKLGEFDALRAQFLLAVITSAKDALAKEQGNVAH
jgi:hypothetical protein